MVLFWWNGGVPQIGLGYDDPRSIIRRRAVRGSRLTGTIFGVLPLHSLPRSALSKKNSAIRHCSEKGGRSANMWPSAFTFEVHHRGVGGNINLNWQGAELARIILPTMAT